MSLSFNFVFILFLVWLIFSKNLPLPIPMTKPHHFGFYSLLLFNKKIPLLDTRASSLFFFFHFFFVSFVNGCWLVAYDSKILSSSNLMWKNMQAAINFFLQIWFIRSLDIGVLKAGVPILIPCSFLHFNIFSKLLIMYPNNSDYKKLHFLPLF